jgi:hypothetical protein
MPIFEVERDGQIFELEAPDMQSGIKAMEPYLGGGMQQASAPGTGTEPEPAVEQGRWGPNPLKMAVNLPGSAYENIGNMVSAVTSPIETVKGVYNAGWDGFTKMMADRYGSYDNFVHTMENDPFGWGMDVSMVGGPAAMGLRATGLTAKAGKVGTLARGATKAADMAAKLDPFSAAASAAAQMGKGTGRALSTGLGMTTNTDEAIGTAARAGYEGVLSSPTAGKVLDKAGLGAAKGSDAGKAFRDQQSGVGDPAAMVDKAREVIDSKELRNKLEFNKKMEPVMLDDAPLDFTLVDKTVDDITNRAGRVPAGSPPGTPPIARRDRPLPQMQEALDRIEYYRKGGMSPKDYVDPKAPPGSPKGFVMTSPAVSAVYGKGKRGGKVIVQKAKKAQFRKADWTDLPDAPDTWRMNTFDQMRKEIGEIMGETPIDSPARAQVGRLYYAVRRAVDDTYKAKSPNGAKYGKILDEASDNIALADDIVKTFSLKEGTARDTALRKLFSAMRPSLSAGNFGGRSSLGQALVDMGHKNLMYEIAGAHTRPWMKNSIGTWATGAVGTSLSGSGAISPYFLSALVAFSPKIIGRAAYESGRVAGAIIKPAVAIERALRRKINRPLAKKLGRAGADKVQKGAFKTAQYGAAQAGRLADVGENREQLKADILAEAKKRGYQVHDRVLNTTIDKIMGDDPDAYLQGVRAVGRNPRLLKLFMDMGTKGEQ